LRDQAILHPSQPMSRTFKVFSQLSHNIVTLHYERLSDNFVDNLVYTSHWHPYIQQTMKEWGRVSFESSFFLLGNIWLLFYLPVPTTIGVISAVLFAISILSSVFLRHQHSGLVDASSAEIHTHLDSLRSQKWGFGPAALLFSTPLTSQLWGLILAFVEGVLGLYALVGFSWVFGAGLFGVGFLVGALLLVQIGSVC